MRTRGSALDAAAFSSTTRTSLPGMSPGFSCPTEFGNLTVLTDRERPCAAILAPGTPLEDPPVSRLRVRYPRQTPPWTPRVSQFHDDDDDAADDNKHLQHEPHPQDFPNKTDLPFQQSLSLGKIPTPRTSSPFSIRPMARTSGTMTTTGPRPRGQSPVSSTAAGLLPIHQAGTTTRATSGPTESGKSESRSGSCRLSTTSRGRRPASCSSTH